MSITASIQPGPKIIALSSDGSKLYVADTKTRSLLVFFTHEGTLEKIISIKIIPKIMIFSLDKQKLYIGGGSAIAVVDISINEFVKKVDIEIAKINICGLAFFSNSLLYVSNANDKQVLKINVSEMSDDKPLKIAGDKVITVGENPHAIVKGSSNIYVLNTGSNSVSVIDPSTDPIDFKIKCDNPESMVLSADSARLYIAGGFTNKIVSYDIVKKSLDTIDVGLNPRKIVLGNNGARIYTICFDGVVSFWTEKRYIRHDKILIPLATKKNKDPFAEAEDSAVMRRQAQTQAEIKAIDAELRAGPYGMFQGKDVSRSSDNFADPSVKSGQHFKADQSPKGDKLNSLVNNGSVSKSVKKDELTKSKFKLSQKLQNYKITTSTEDESIFISMELLKANFSGSSGSTPGCFSCFNKLGGQAKTREAIMNQDAQLISERLKVLLEDIATVNLTSTEVPVLVISSLTKDTTEVIKVLEAIGIAVNQSTATLRNK